MYERDGKVYANAEEIVKILQDNLRDVKEGRPSNIPDIVPTDGIITLTEGAGISLFGNNDNVKVE